MATLIDVDEDLEDLIPGFLANREKDLIDIFQALEKKDFEPIKVIGHKMAGSSRGYGFIGLEEIGQKLEQYAEAQSLDDCQDYYRKMKDYLSDIEIRYV